MEDCRDVIVARASNFELLELTGMAEKKKPLGFTYGRAGKRKIEDCGVSVDEPVFWTRGAARVEGDGPSVAIVRREGRVEVPKPIADVFEGCPKAGVTFEWFGQFLKSWIFHEDASLACAEIFHGCLGDTQSRRYRVPSGVGGFQDAIQPLNWM